MMPPFFLLSSIGGRKDMRGYAFGRYLDRVAYTLQSEYRYQAHPSWIVTGFAGVGEVAPGWNSTFQNMLPAAGMGVRYVLSKKYKVNIALDVARGRNDTHYYITLGEAF